MGTAPTLLPSPPSPLHYSADKRAVIQYCRRGAAGLVGLMEIGLACKNAARIGAGLGESNVHPTRPVTLTVEKVTDMHCKRDMVS